MDTLFPILRWERRPIAHCNRANYYLLRGEVFTGYVVKWCGHPTALRPYFLIHRDKDLPLQTFRTVADAKEKAERLLLTDER